VGVAANVVNRRTPQIDEVTYLADEDILCSNCTCSMEHNILRTNGEESSTAHGQRETLAATQTAWRAPGCFDARHACRGGWSDDPHGKEVGDADEVGDETVRGVRHKSSQRPRKLTLAKMPEY
jgi:hypothetical protein